MLSKSHYVTINNICCLCLSLATFTKINNMVKEKTVEGWNIPEIGLNLKDNEDDVESIFCKICKEYYLDDENGWLSLANLVGNVRKTILNWVGDSKVVKKNNAQDHLKGNYHITAVGILRERACEKGGEDPQQTEAEKLAATLATNREVNILFHVRQLNQKQREQLLKKFQLAHFVVTHNLSFNIYREIAVLERDSHGVELDNGFLTNKSGREMTIYLTTSLLRDNIVQPLHEKYHLYFSLLYDGFSAEKINDEKELYVIKTYNQDTPKFDVLSL